MFGLSALGVVHTLFGIIAIAVGAWILYRDKEISPANQLGRIYLITTLLASVTALMIFRRGPFGPGHALAVLTLAALAVGMVAARTNLYGKYSRYLQALSFSATLLFNAIPGITEALTRLPFDSPLFAGPEAPQFKTIYAVMVVLFVSGAALQFRWIRKQTGR
jgi:uncharacterized membrane protein